MSSLKIFEEQDKMFRLHRRSSFSFSVVPSECKSENWPH